jgi:DNA-directed RNA polymerase subunit beta'
LVDVSQDVVITEIDCGDTEGFGMKRKDSEEFGLPLGARIFSRTIFKDIKDETGKVIVKAGEIIDVKKSELIDAANVAEVTLRSPITCKTKFGICQKCYGYNLGDNKLVGIGTAVGVIAAQAIGEPGTQLTMRTFHTGGVASASDITAGLPRVQEVFEARIPKGKAIISEVDGKVIEVHDKGKQKTIKIQLDKSVSTSSDEPSPVKKSSKKSGDVEVIEYSVPGSSTLWVTNGDLVTKGQQLSEGSLDLKEVFSISGFGVAANYVLNEIQTIYNLQGADINAKHIEVVIRQMFGRVRIKDAGDTNFTPGDIIEKVTLIEENGRTTFDGNHQSCLDDRKLALCGVIPRNRQGFD